MVIIPWRSAGDPDRDAACEYVRSYYADALVVSDGREGPFNRSAAYNRGFAATDEDPLVWNEADTIVPRDQLDKALAMAAESDGLVVPFTERWELDQPVSRAVLEGAEPFEQVPYHVYTGGRSVGACGVTSRATIEAVGGWDEHFSGWGYDDTAMFEMFNRLVGPTRWIDGPSVHLWHPKPIRTGTGRERLKIRENKARLVRIRGMSDDELRHYAGIR